MHVIAVCNPASIGDGASVLVVSPHPDDDVIGCGGTLARLAERGTPCTVAYVTDGSQSYPGSAAFAPERIARIREAEARQALAATRDPCAAGLSSRDRRLARNDG